MKKLRNAGLMALALMAGLLGTNTQAWAAPTVSLTAPTANSSYAQWSNVSLAADAASTGGSIAKVDFYANDGTTNTLAGTAWGAPYSILWNAGTGGNYQLTAVVTDNLGAQTTSTAVPITVVVPPTVTLTAPANNAVMGAPGTFTLNATASTLGSIAQVEFYNGTTLLGTATTAPYTYTWSNVAAGTYTVSAKATDTLGQSGVSNYNNVTVATSPAVSLTGPTTGATVPAPGSITLTANAWGTSSTLKKVDFYSGTTLLGTSTAAPYSFTWNNVAAGNYTLTAVATDANNLSTTSTAVNVTVTASNQPPAVSLTAPAVGSSYAQWSNLTLTANASDPDGSISKVDYYANDGTTNTLLGTVTTAPYTWIWNAGTAGQYQITAVATDNLGAQTTSTIVPVTIVAPPTVNLTAPANNAVVTGPATLTLSASTSTLGSIAQVDFYNGNTLLGTATSAPYTFTWSNVAAGTYTLSAKATDALGQSKVSNYNNVTVATPPYVALTSPTAGATATSPGSFTLTVNAWGTSSTLQSVSFYSGTMLLGTSTAAPYSYTWNNVPAGNYAITAQATDGNGLTSTSTAVSVSVTGTGGAVQQVYYIHADHLNTPRQITDASGNVVWRWGNTDPFGNNMPNENPAGAGQFGFNLRFPGQYYDRETNLNYNYFRDYDPALGRYLQSDPIGLQGGINTYTYVLGNPLSYVDPLGLANGPAVGWMNHSGSVQPISIGDIANAYLAWRQNNLDTLERAINGDPNATLEVAMGFVGGTGSVGRIWASTSRLSSVENAFGHWSKHGNEFSCPNAKSYVQTAQDFLANPPEGALTKTRANGDRLVYDPATNTFAVSNSNGVPRTMFKPSDGINYWNRQ